MPIKYRYNFNNTINNGNFASKNRRKTLKYKACYFAQNFARKYTYLSISKVISRMMFDSKDTCTLQLFCVGQFIAIHCIFILLLNKAPIEVKKHIITKQIIFK